MRANKEYAVSIQWGAGMHYFERYFDDEKAAVQYAAMRQINLSREHKRKGGRGAKPHVEVWNRIPYPERERILK